MGTIEMFNMDKEELEDVADLIKRCILRALGNEGLLDWGVAEEWARTHTVITKKKSFFRTLSKLWGNQVEDGATFYLVVKLVE